MLTAALVAETVRAMVEAVNRGEFATAADTFSTDPVIVEDIAPFRWTGTGAVEAWLGAMGANAARMGATAIIMALDEPTRIEISQDRAYALVPGKLTLSSDSEPMVADGILTFILEGQDGNCLIDTLIWSGSSLTVRA
jgi:Domain of unknown function (DUF4440)